MKNIQPQKEMQPSPWPFFPPRRFMHPWHISLLFSQWTLNSVCGSGGNLLNLNLALYGQFLPLSYENLMQGCPERGLMRDYWIFEYPSVLKPWRSVISLFAVPLLWDDQDWISTVSHCAVVHIDFKNPSNWRYCVSPDPLTLEVKHKEKLNGIPWLQTSA